MTIYATRVIFREDLLPRPVTLRGVTASLVGTCREAARGAIRWLLAGTFIFVAGAPAHAQLVSSVTLKPTTVVGGKGKDGNPTPVNGTVTLSAAPAAAVTIQLSSDDDNKTLTFNPTAVVAAGSKTATFTVTAAAVAVSTQVNISAELGISSKSTSLMITPPSNFDDRAPLTQTLVGLDVVGASSTSPAAVFLAAAGLDLPFENFDDKEIINGRNVVFWGGGLIKIAGIAQPGNISQLSSISSYIAPAVNSTPDKIVQSIDGSAFAALQFHKWSVPRGTFDDGSPMDGKDEPTYLTASVLISGGGITPLSLSQSNPQIYISTPQIQQLPGVNLPTTCSTPGSTSTTCYVAFVPADRSRFYHYYNAGLRFKLYAPDYKDNEFRFPATFDLTVGQNEYVTGGQLDGLVFHLGGTLPIPYLDGFYAFGSMDMAVSRTVLGPQLLLTPAPSTANLTLATSSVTLVTVPQPDRDRYALGFGIDFYHLYTSVEKKKAKPSTAN